MVSAYAAQNRLCLGQSTVQEKANEIVAIPKLLDLLDHLQGCTITFDAMECQKEIAEKIAENKALHIIPCYLQINSAVRSHWGIENRLHWVLNVIFNEDNSLKKKDHSAVNFNMIVKVTLALLEQEQTFKASKNGKRTRAALDDWYREKILKY